MHRPNRLYTQVGGASENRPSCAEEFVAGRFVSQFHGPCEKVASMEIYHPPQVGILDLPLSIFAKGADTMKWLLLNCALLLLSWSPAAGQEQPAVCAHQQSCIQDGTFHSQSLGRDVRYRVILPANMKIVAGFRSLSIARPIRRLLELGHANRTRDLRSELPFLIVMPMR